MIPPFRNSAAVELRSNGWTVLSYSRLASGVDRFNGHVHQLPLDATDEQIGNACIDAGRWSRERVDESEFPVEKLHSILGYRSRAAYMKGARSVTLHWSVEGDKVEISILVARGAGFEYPHPIPKIAVLDLSPRALGAEVRAAFERRDF